MEEREHGKERLIPTRTVMHSPVGRQGLHSTLTRIHATGQEERNKPESSVAKLYSYIFRSQRARAQEQELYCLHL